MVMIFVVFIWGLSEATWFFIIPDVVLSFYALRVKRFKFVMYANIAAVLGAMAGGIIIFIWSSVDYAQAVSFMLGIPAIHDYMMAHVHSAMADNTFTAL